MQSLSMLFSNKVQCECSRVSSEYIGAGLVLAFPLGVALREVKSKERKRNIPRKLIDLTVSTIGFRLPLSARCFFFFARICMLLDEKGIEC